MMSWIRLSGFARGTALLLAAVLVLLLAAATRSEAARPVAGGLYADTDSGYAYWAYLKVSKSRNRLNPRGSRVEGPGCGAGWRIHLGSRRRPVAITKAGRFNFSRRRAGYVFRIRGRFTSEDTASVSFRYRREPRRRACEDSGRIALNPAHVGRTVPFRSCATHEAETVLRSPTGRVFWERQWNRYEGWIKVAYACLFSSSERYRLHRDDDDDSDLSLIRLAGSYVAYAWHPCGGAACVSQVVEIRDLRDGSRLDVNAGPLGSVTDLELKDNGSIALINLPWPPGAPAEVWADDNLGARRLDTGNIATTSLALEGSTLTWLRDGDPRTATLDLGVPGLSQ